MLTIWKYPLGTTDHQELNIPANALPLCVERQRDQLCLWVKVDSYADLKQMNIFTHGTGHKLESSTAEYLGTFQLMEGQLIFHVFWEWEEE